MERLAILAHKEDQSNHALCTVLWSSIEGQDWELHAQAKPRFEVQFTTGVEAAVDSIQKHKAHTLKNNVIRTQ